MRILMLSQFYAPIIGGIEQVVRNLSVALVQRGHEVAVGTLQHPGTPEFEVDQGVRIYRIRSFAQQIPWAFGDASRQHATPWPDPGTMLALRRLIQQEKPDVVHAHDWLSRSFLPLKRWSKARFVMTQHAYHLACAKHRLVYHGQPCIGPGFAKCLACASEHYGPARGTTITVANWIMGKMERATTDMFLPISRAVAEGNGLVRHHLPFQVIPNFVLDETRADQENLSAYINQLPSGPYVLFVGDLSHDKGVDVLLGAYAQIEQAPPLVLIGRRCADTPVEFPPNVFTFSNWPHAAVLEAWNRSLIAVAPSTWNEPFGMVAIEAMAAGRPVIASRTGGLVDIVHDGETGLLVPPGDVPALRQALARLLAETELREKMGRAGKQRVKAFGADVIVPLFEQMYLHKSYEHENLTTNHNG